MRIDKMKTARPRAKRPRPRQQRVLSGEEVAQLRTSRASVSAQKRFFTRTREEHLRSQSGFDLHGLALARFLLHSHPSAEPFTLANTRITYVSSSINVVDERLMFDLAYSFVPGFPFESRHLSKDLSRRIAESFSVVFPGETYVQESALGPQNANCIFLDHDRFHSRKFQKTAMAKFEGNGAVRGNDKVVPHLKVCVVSNRGGELSDDTIVYVGSHNMTKAAWGRYNRLGTTCYVSNYEMGVLLPPRPGSAKWKKELVRKLGFVYPAARFGPGERPFMRKKTAYD